MEKKLSLRHLFAVVILVASSMHSYAVEGDGSGMQGAANDVQIPQSGQSNSGQTKPIQQTHTFTKAPRQEGSVPTAAPAVDPAVDPKTAVSATIPVKSGKDSGHVPVVVQPSPFEPNALNILRQKMKTMAEGEHQRNEAKGWLKSSLHRFTPESMTFFVAIGLVTFNSMWISSHGDPLAMQRHLDSITDPIAHASFYAFMAANGFYIEMKTSKMDAATRQQMMRRLSYQGMAIGSLASSIVADLGHSGKACVDLWIKGKNDEKSAAACNQAWAQWTTRGKFQQYFPQIMAMWASQAVTEVIDSSGRQFLLKQTAREKVRNILTKKFLVNQAYRITGADVALTVAEGGTFGFKVLRWAGKLIQFSMFVGIDHAMSPFTYRPMNNVIKPALFDFDAMAINNYWGALDQINWDESRLSEANVKVCGAVDRNCLERRFLEEIENFGTQSQQWREHLNSDAETGIAGWMELTKNLLNQIDYSYKFYSDFVGQYFKVINLGARIGAKETPPPDTSTLAMFPFRKLPYYGVGIGEYKSSGMSINDAYLLYPLKLEKAQAETVHNYATDMSKVKGRLTGKSLEKMNSLLELLLSNDRKKVGNALLEINRILGHNQIIRPTSLMNRVFGNSEYSPEFNEILSVFRKALGDPNPISYEFAGFAQSFAANSMNNSVAEAANFSLWSTEQKFAFNKEADLMTYRIFCGQDRGSLREHVARFDFFGLKDKPHELDMLAPQYDPPTLLKKSPALDQYCGSTRRTKTLDLASENLYGQIIDGKSMQDFFIANFKYDIVGEFRKKDSASQFEKWWLENGRKPIDASFKKYDEKFKELVEISKQNIFDQRSYVNWFVDHLNQSDYLQKSVKANLQFETNFYLQLVTRALDTSEVKYSDKFNYLKAAVQQSQNEKFISIARKPTLPEVQKVQDLLNAYYLLILQEPVKFEQYIAHSKKINEAINDLQVLGGLKTKKEPVKPSDLLKSDPAAPPPSAAEMDVFADEEAANAATPSKTGNENAAATYEDVPNKNPNLRQKTLKLAVQGLQMVESEIRRFIRMRIALSQSLELDTEEFMKDFSNKSVDQLKNSAPGKASPRGG